MATPYSRNGGVVNGKTLGKVLRSGQINKRYIYGQLCRRSGGLSPIPDNVGTLPVWGKGGLPAKATCHSVDCVKVFVLPLFKRVAFFVFRPAGHKISVFSRVKLAQDHTIDI